MSGSSISLDRAVDLTRTGDVWLFRGRTGADRAIQNLTNSPVNHVGMAIVVEDLPPLMWHAELGRSLPDVWTGRHQRGVQLHDLRDAVATWHERYHQRVWLRQLEPTVGREREDAALRTVARLDGTPFPSTARLASRWARGRLPRAGARAARVRDSVLARVRAPLARRRGDDGVPPAAGSDVAATEPALVTAYCAEVVAVTYEEMGLLTADRRPNWYDPGRFWSGDRLPLVDGFALGGEIAVSVDGR
ncbi:hypothetical protein GCM10023403_00310 [Pseudonocardia benzenivorans]|uniref:Guanylate cyclase n=3 Tax=Pseudonocardia TaxID=1847 RepID=F4CPX2_PSEUX|nr:hypothetical protein [Pseudonocardia dioxanivorans]AEA26155.1 hypothetical protein Psed_3989 [Pseudonocardia dioxanivorans CB1190]GJF02941.1 hypothetical protein PSD17_19020 [Pseudonocardia sp. D17]